MGYTLSSLALADIEDIWAYIAADSTEAADKVVFKIFEAVDTLVQMPMVGRSRFEVRPDVRSYSVAPYIIFYIPKGDAVEIIRILHGARDIESLLN